MSGLIEHLCKVADSIPEVGGSGTPFHISNAVYSLLADEVLDACRGENLWFGWNGPFSGTVELEFEGLVYLLNYTVRVYASEDWDDSQHRWLEITDVSISGFDLQVYDSKDEYGEDLVTDASVGAFKACFF